MATIILPSAMNGDNGLLSFFTKISEVRSEKNEVNLGSEIEYPEYEVPSYGSKEQSAKSDGMVRQNRIRNSDVKAQRTLQDMLNPEALTPHLQNNEARPQTPITKLSDSEQSASGRKRPRANPGEFARSGEGPLPLEVERRRSPLQIRQQMEESDLFQPKSPQAMMRASSPPSESPMGLDDVPKSPPRKMLRLNASGKFSSPISNKGKNEEQSDPKRRRGRPRKSKEMVQQNYLVKFAYGKGEDIGRQIGRILSGEERVVSPLPTEMPNKQRAPRRKQQQRPTHPFFLTKSEDEVPTKQESTQKTSTVTPGKLKKQATNVRPAHNETYMAEHYTSMLLRDRLIARHPGAKEPAWPSRMMSHVRGLDPAELNFVARLFESVQRYDKRKRKTAQRQFQKEDSILNHSTFVRPDQDGALRVDGFREPHPSLRLPRRLVVSKSEIAHRIEGELLIRLEGSGNDHLSNLSGPHPALKRLAGEFAAPMSKRIQRHEESLSWTSKYAPSQAVDVLQPFREMSVLKDWLSSLTVSAVESKSKAKPKSMQLTKARKKQRQKHDDLDGFLADSDEEEPDMKELHDPNEIQSCASRKGLSSVVQRGVNGTKLSNAILISGPHGCGKSAAAYAVAKQVGFKVFEISPGERRSGKDVLDKVGDMTENHLVRHHGVDQGEPLTAEGPSVVDEAFERDLASGRQGKMDAFFKTRPKSGPKQSSPKQHSKTEPIDEVQKLLKRPTRDQQQSLILLEEVDVLFKEDKDFWTTVFKLIISSKRPFILTCNDEQLVPLQAMNLHAILRFSPPPVDLAIDYMLLIAANEGHILRRDAVTSMFVSKHHDLRASIVELEFWCQMGIGDPRGGLSWIFQRWPPGSDVDQHGRTLHMVSEDSLQNNIYLLPESGLDELSQVLHVYHQCGIRPMDLVNCSHTSALETIPTTLKDFAFLSDSMSAIDVFAGSHSHDNLDATKPLLPDKTRAHYIEGMALLQADECVDYSHLGVELAISATLSAYRDVGLLEKEDLRARLEFALMSRKQVDGDGGELTRHDFACFDAIAVPPENVSSLSSELTLSTFDGPLEPITADLAPYVRSIVQFDKALAEQRLHMSQITGDGHAARRVRTTRAARSALEGSQRASTRRERWFPVELDGDAVLATGGSEWPTAAVSDVWSAGSRDGTEAPESSAEQ